MSVLRLHAREAAADAPFSLATLDGLLPALAVIEQATLKRRDLTPSWRRWRYDELAALCGREEDWAYPGCIRGALTGGEARSWLRRRFRLWWRGDDEYRAGLLFTANPRTGMSWDRDRIASRCLRDAQYLADAAGGAALSQPLHRPAFLAIERCAQQMGRATQKLYDIGGLSG